MELMLLLLIFSTALPSSSPQPLHVPLARIDGAAAAAANLTDTELLRRAVRRSHDRLAGLRLAMASRAAKAISAEVPVGAQERTGEYVVRLGIGTPALWYTAVVDTAGDLIWTQCQPCRKPACFPQPDPIFAPKLSSSFALVPCHGTTCHQINSHKCQDGVCRYVYDFGEEASTGGALATEKFSIGDGVYPGLVFGCSDTTWDDDGELRQASGLVGLGRGALSLVSQLAVRKFTYCLPAPSSTATGKLILGAGANPPRKLPAAATVTIPMVQNPKQPSLYYVNLNGLRVGGVALPVNSTSLAGDGDGGMIVDAGTTLTFLERAVYEELVRGLAEQINLARGDGTEMGLDLCFILPAGVDMSRVYVPPVSLAFDGEWLDLEKERLFVEEGGRSLMCLMMARADGVSVLGNFQQQNMQVEYDLEREKLTFAKVACDLLG